MSRTLVIFGASGDLTSRKLIPALYVLFRKNRLPAGTKIVGVARSAYTHEAFRTHLETACKEFDRDSFDPTVWANFAAGIYYQAGDILQDADHVALGKFLAEIEGEEKHERLYYLSTSPTFYGPTIERLGRNGLTDETRGARRIVIEKPFGTDLATAKQLNRAVHGVFREDQVYRIDHYLGKETVQNILVLRFANAIFEPLWNRNYIDHIQITAAEELVVGRRAAFYETSGVLRDMFQNHLMQLLMVTAMEGPARYDAEAVRNEKVKVLQAIRPMTPREVAADTIRGQYRGYRQEQGAAPDSQTATFAAIKLHIDNWRWQGVPFYLRSGKAMSCRTTQIVVQFRQPPLAIFTNGKGKCGNSDPNRLVIQIQPAEGIQIQFQTKVPDAGMQVRLKEFDFRFSEQFEAALPEAYQRLLLDALLGDASLFARADEVETAWGIIDPILKAWESASQPPLLEYELGEWGPDASAEWMRWQSREWFDLCPALH